MLKSLSRPSFHNVDNSNLIFLFLLHFKIKCSFTHLEYFHETNKTYLAFVGSHFNTKSFITLSLVQYFLLLLV